MACISRQHGGAAASPDPRAWNMHPTMQGFRENGGRPVPALSERDPRHNHQVPPAAHPFQQAKSPISHCIDTIIGAAEVLAKRDSWAAEQDPQPARVSSSSSRKSSSSSRPSQKEPARSKKQRSVFMHPLEQLLEDDEELHKKLILTMALQRPRQPNNPHPTKEPSRVIGEGFYWKEYPLLEDVLYEHMEEYYDWSSNQRQSKTQQAFNNALVEKVRHVAFAQGVKFDPIHFTDKRLRDRIRCFYKTHLQNAKKRLTTMKKHLDSDDQRQALQTLIDRARNNLGVQHRLVPVVSTSDGEEDASIPKKKRQRSR